MTTRAVPVSIVCPLGWSGVAALVLALVPVLDAAPARAIALDAVLQTDGLGYDCVPENLLETAFAAEDKGAMLPQTCLPEPCERQLSRDDLAVLIGAMPDVRRWDEYVGRYGDVCVDETRVAWGESGPETLVAESIPSSPSDDREVLRADRSRFFGAPTGGSGILPTLASSTSSRGSGGGGTPRLGSGSGSTGVPPFPFAAGLPPFTFGRTGTPGGDPDQDLTPMLVLSAGSPNPVPPLVPSDVPPDETVPRVGPPTPSPVPVPLPNGVWLLCGAVGVLAVFRRRRALHG